MIFIIITIAVLSLLFYTVNKIVFDGKWEWVIIFCCLYFPFYTTVLSIAWKATHIVWVVKFFQGLKELVVVMAVISFLFYERNIFEYPIRLRTSDKLFLCFITLSVLYLFLPLGEANFVSKAIYLKNIMLMGVFYFFGRNSRFEEKELRILFKGIMILAVGAFFLNIIESTIGTHFQQFTGYALFNSKFYDMEPSGNYGLTWTFETQTGSKRLASFFSDPLDLAASSLMAFSVGLIWYLTTERRNATIYILVMFAAVMSIYFSSSRASFAAFFIMLFFIALIFRLHTLLKIGVSLVVIFILYVLMFAEERFYYFVYDTITFQNASSVGHVVEWLIALQSMIDNPLGIGLAMSGNSSTVSDQLRVGGENQYLIFGVQLGFIGMIFYIATLFSGIWISLKTFRMVNDVMVARVAFVACTVKFGMLLPLFTSNAENFFYVALLSWWMVGYSVKAFNKSIIFNQAGREALTD